MSSTCFVWQKNHFSFLNLSTQMSRSDFQTCRWFHLTRKSSARDRKDNEDFILDLLSFIVLNRKIVIPMSDSINTNESMIWCAKTGEIQSLKSLLKEVRSLSNEFLIYSLHDLFSIRRKSTNKWTVDLCYTMLLMPEISMFWKN